MSVSFACQHRYRDGFTLDASFTSNGRCTVLFGPSGSGKTSILSMIAGVLKPDSPMSTAEIISAIKAAGFKSKSKNLRTMVSQALSKDERI